VLHTFVCSLSIGLALSLGLAAAASAKKVDPTKMTCSEYLSMSESEQPVAAAFLEGWSKGKKHVDIGEVGLDRDVTTLVVSCKETPKESLWRRFEKHVPVLKKHVKPIEMKCEDFVGLESDVQPELYYYLDGYDRATRTQTDVAGEVDLEQDYATFIQVCKQAPKESFWAKLKAHFEKKK
jgi:acid stress chaperone HdeA